MAGDDKDWRLTGQESYLSGRRLLWRKWWSYTEAWDHDHCAFCWAEFASDVSEHTPYDAGWVTADDDYTWICPVCFEDFKDRFGWTVEP